MSSSWQIRTSDWRHCYNTVSRSLDSQCMVMGAAVPGNVENNKHQIPHNIAMPPWCRCDAMSIPPILSSGDQPTQQQPGHWAHRKYSILHQHQDITHTASPWCRVMLLCWPGMCPCCGALWGKLRLFLIPHGVNVFRVKLAVKVCVECGVYETTYFKQS